MWELRRFSNNQLIKEVMACGIVVARNMLLAHTTNKLTDLDHIFLGVVPDLKELWKTIKRMPSDCSLGLDGITIEVLKTCWDFIGHNILEMIIFFL